MINQFNQCNFFDYYATTQLIVSKTGFFVCLFVFQAQPLYQVEKKEVGVSGGAIFFTILVFHRFYSLCPFAEASFYC